MSNPKQGCDRIYLSTKQEDSSFSGSGMSLETIFNVRQKIG